VFDGVIYHGAMQFELSAVPRGATIHAAVLEVTGLDDRRLPASLNPTARDVVGKLDGQRSLHQVGQRACIPGRRIFDSAASRCGAT